MIEVKDDNYEQQQSLDEINNTIHFDHKVVQVRVFSIFRSWFTRGSRLYGPRQLDYIHAVAHNGYTLLFVILISSLAAMLLQSMTVRLGIATGKDLAQMTRHF